MKILFMGSPDFAVVSLEALYKAGHEIAGVVSVPDKPIGRGKKMTAMPVKQAAERLGLPVFCPQTLRDGAFLETLKSLESFGLVVGRCGRPEEKVGR